MNGPILEVESLDAGYGKLVVLQDVSIAVEPQQFVAILGPNGSGKSTMLKAIFGLTQIFDGAISLGGQPLIGMPTENISNKGIAYVPQRENVFTTMSVRENLLLAVRKMGRAEAERATDDAFGLFPILAERAGLRAGQLSGGERQMLAIAMGWLSGPQIMMLDEPSAGLAPRYVTEVFRTLTELCQQGITLIVVEQNARSILRWCDYAYILREGRLAFEGRAAEILEDEETAKGYLGVSTRRSIA